MYLIVGLIVFMNVIKELSWEWEPRKMKEMSSMKRFQKQIRWRKVRIMLRSSLPMNRLAWGEGSHPGIVVPMEVLKIWCICVSINLKMLYLRMKSSIKRNIWGGEQFVGNRCLNSCMK